MISTGNEKQYGSGTGTSDNNFNNNKSDIGNIADCNGSSGGNSISNNQSINDHVRIIIIVIISFVLILLEVVWCQHKATDWVAYVGPDAHSDDTNTTDHNDTRCARQGGLPSSADTNWIPGRI